MNKTCIFPTFIYLEDKDVINNISLDLHLNDTQKSNLKVGDWFNTKDEIKTVSKVYVVKPLDTFISISEKTKSLFVGQKIEW